MDINLIREQAKCVVSEFFNRVEIEPESLFVLGCSSSEICGGKIGKSSNEEVGLAVIEAILPIFQEKGIYLAVQGCEHINRALVIEREAQKKYGFDEVTVVPHLNAGGACSKAAFYNFKDPVMVEHVKATAGLDIGDTFIGMHIKHVAVPLRLSIKEIGSAHVTAVYSRPKLIGGERARYTR